MAELQTFSINRFLGINKSTTDTLLELGESSDMSNFMITDDLKLKKVFGYGHIFDTLGARRIRGMWYGELVNSVYFFLFACNGHVYSHNLSTGANTDLGTLADTDTTFFIANNAIYIINGMEMYSWTGAGNITAVEGYVPTVYTASPPTGGGTMLEAINYLTGKKAQKFSANGSATVYQIAELGVASIDSVYVNDVLKTLNTDYTVNLTNGTITFVTAPATGVNNVSITWTKTTSGDRGLITANRYYGGVYYSRFWLFGNAGHKNTRYVSGITLAGVSDPTYWPKYADSDVGDYEISDIKTQYNRQLIWTTGDSSEASAWYSYEEDYADPVTGIVTALFPVLPLNSKVGNVAKGQVQLIINNPFTIWQGVYQWVSTNVNDEKNATWMSKNIQKDIEALAAHKLQQALTVDWNSKGLYLLCVDKKIWIYNYRVGVWYVLDIAHKPTCFVLVDSELYFGTDEGRIMKFGEALTTFDGTTISAYWDMGFYNFGAEWLRKFIQTLFISIVPEVRSYLEIKYQTDVNGLSETYIAVNNLSTMLHTDFASYSFKTNYNPQPFKFKIRAKKIDYFKLILSNDTEDPCTIISITLPTRIGGEVKRRY